LLWGGGRSILREITMIHDVTLKMYVMQLDSRNRPNFSRQSAP
jgi:hypothetical protein